jgi:hypothetical protein
MQFIEADLGFRSVLKCFQTVRAISWSDFEGKELEIVLATRPPPR